MTPLSPAPSSGAIATVVRQLADLSPSASYLVLAYLTVRQLLPVLLPVLLIALGSRDATPTQRIDLVRDYLLQNVGPNELRAAGGRRTRRRAGPGHPRSGTGPPAAGG